MTIAHRIRLARQAAGLTQAELARRVGVTGECVSLWERGQRTPNSAYIPALAKACGVGPGWFFAGLGGTSCTGTNRTY